MSVFAGSVPKKEKKDITLSYNSFVIKQFSKPMLKGSIHEMFGIFRPRSLNDLLRSAFLHDLSFVHHQHPVAKRLHQSQIMADKQKRKLVLLLQRF